MILLFVWMGEGLMDRKVLILPNDGGKVFERVLNTTLSGQLERHATGYLEYIKQKALEYPGYEEDAGYCLATYLSSCGCVVLQMDNPSVFYFPETFVDSQYYWLRSHKREIRRWNFSIVDIDEGSIHHYDQITLDGVAVYQKFRELLEDKNVVSYAEAQEGELGYVSRIRNL